MKVGDIKKLPNKRGEDFTVEIVNLFTYEGEEWAEVKPVDFNGFTREVKVNMLYD
jgi:hypothetical protein